MRGVVTRQHSKRYRELAHTPHGGGLHREILLDGLHLLFEARASGIPIESAAFEHAVLEQPAVRSLAETLARSGVEVLIVSRSVLQAMSPVKTPSGAVGIARRSMATLTEVLRAQPALAVLAYDVQDPGNVGALMRAAEAAGATALVACGATADPLGWKALRGSMGSALRLPIARADIDDALAECRKAGIQVAALAPRGGDAFFTTDLRAPTALLVGSEGSGLPADVARRADRQISIPMQSPVESLNVAVAAALVLYEAFRQRHP